MTKRTLRNATLATLTTSHHMLAASTEGANPTNNTTMSAMHVLLVLGVLGMAGMVYYFLLRNT